MTININTQHPEEAFLKCFQHQQSESNRGARNGRYSPVVIVKAIFGGLSLATRTEDKRMKEEKKDKNRRCTMSWWNHKIKKPNPTESCKPLWTKYIQVTAKNRHTRCSYPRVNLSVDHRFAVNVQSSQKRLCTPMGTKGLGLKEAAFTFLSMHLPLVRGLKTTSESDEHWFTNWAVW